jgi:Protein of unknown function (DUF4038)/Putative collagen-binding domain of a collagenase
MKSKSSPPTNSINRSLRTAALAVTLSFTVCVADQARPGDPQWSARPAGLPTYPLKASVNGRYLVDQNGTPTVLVGDSPHSLFVNLSTQQADAYFANRASYGINALWVEVLCNTYTAGRPDGSTYDGIIPFTTPGDMSTPNPAYFSRLDQMVQLAANHGIQIVMDTFETAGWMSVLEQNGIRKALEYGKYLGNRYKNFNNIIWITGNDFQTWNTSTTDNHLIAAIMRGIASTDPNHLQTTELSYLVSGSLDDALLVPYTSLAGAYTYYPTYAEVLHEYNEATFVPVFMEEANYEFEDNTGMDYGDPETLRRQEYWTMLSGATGQLYGNHYTWTFESGWQHNLNTPGIRQLQYMKDFFSARQWWDLVPDQTHTVVIAGYGTFSDTGSLHDNDYVTAARVPDGSLVLAFCPTSTTITIDMTQMRGRTKARWFDPSNNTFSRIDGSPFGNTGTQDFTTPGNNGDGDPDWVLVLESP